MVSALLSLGSANPLLSSLPASPQCLTGEGGGGERRQSEAIPLPGSGKPSQPHTKLGHRGADSVSVVTPASSSVPGHSKAFWEESLEQPRMWAQERTLREERHNNDLQSRARSIHKSTPVSQRLLCACRTVGVVHSCKQVHSPPKSLACDQYEKFRPGCCLCRLQMRHCPRATKLEVEAASAV